MEIKAMQGNHAKEIYKISGTENEKGSEKVRTKKKDKKEKKNSFYVGEQNILNEKSEQKKRAQKLTKRMVMQQFKKDSKIDSILEESQKKVDKLSDQTGKEKKAILDLEEQKQRLKTEFDIKDDSQEQKDLELLEKAYQMERDGELDKLTEEEMNRVFKLKPLTEYQEMAFRLEYAKDYYLNQLDVEKLGVYENLSTIHGINQMLLGDESMLDTKKQVEVILKKVNKEEIRSQTEQTKEEIYEMQEEVMDKEDKAKEAQEEIKRKIKQNDEIEEIQKGEEQKTGLDEEIKELKDKIEETYQRMYNKQNNHSMYKRSIIDYII